MVVGEIGMASGTPKGIPLSIFVLERNRLHARIDGNCGSREVIIRHMEDIFRQATIFCRRGTNIAVLWMPPCGFFAAMSMRLKDEGIRILPGGHMSVETFALDNALLMRNLRMSDFSIAFEDQQGVARVHGMTGISPFVELCRRLYTDGFRGESAWTNRERIPGCTGAQGGVRHVYDAPTTKNQARPDRP
jgi:hypothetical protein